MARITYTVGDLVSIDLWDATNPPWSRLGTPCLVLSVELCPNSESGSMVTVESKNGTQIRVDSNWLRPYRTIGGENSE